MYVWMLVGTVFFVYYMKLWYAWWPASIFLFALAAAFKVRTEASVDAKVTLDRDDNDIELRSAGSLTTV